MEGESPEDQAIRSYDRRIATLSVGGELRGHLACRILTMSFPARLPWAWFVLTWVDGRRELKFEDYGPGWPMFTELDAGYLDHHGPSTVRRGKFLCWPFETSTPGPPVRYDAAWLPPEEAARVWDELGLRDSDF